MIRMISRRLWLSWLSKIAKFVSQLPCLVSLRCDGHWNGPVSPEIDAAIAIVVTVPLRLRLV